jgi:hypothetical protein
MVDVAAFVKATIRDSVEAADITFRIGRHALADLALQFRLEPVQADRLSDADFAELFAIVDRSTAENVDSRTAQRRLDRLREEYEPNAQALADFLALELPSWFHREHAKHDIQATHSRRGAGRDLVGGPRAGRQRGTR